MQDGPDQIAPSRQGRDGPAAPAEGGEAGRGAEAAQAFARLAGENAALKRSLDDALEIGNEVVHLSREVRTLADAVNRMQNLMLGDNGPSAQASRIDALTEALLDLRDGLGQRGGSREAALHLPSGPAAGGADGPNAAAEQLHLILTSRSWRLLRPVRGVARAIRRLRRR